VRKRWEMSYFVWAADRALVVLSGGLVIVGLSVGKTSLVNAPELVAAAVSDGLEVSVVLPKSAEKVSVDI
jgi:hypothetical protein